MSQKTEIACNTSMHFQPTKLVLANKNYSAWSFRVWLAVQQCAASIDGQSLRTIEERVIPMRTQTWEEDTNREVPGGNNLLPALIVCVCNSSGKAVEAQNSGGKTDCAFAHRNSRMGRVKVDAQDISKSSTPMVLYDSLAICEFLAENYPAADLWPHSAEARYTARCLVSEMHSSFLAMREYMCFNIQRQINRPDPLLNKLPDSTRVALEKDISRMIYLWRRTLGQRWDQHDLRVVQAIGTDTHKCGVRYLFGSKPCLADIFFAPVASRFVAYQIDVAVFIEKMDDASRSNNGQFSENLSDAKSVFQYMETLLTALPGVGKWQQESLQEDHFIPDFEMP